MDSSSEKLLTILRQLEGDENGAEMASAGRIKVDLMNVNTYLSNEWGTVDDFFLRIRKGLEEDLRVVRSELEIYSQSSISAEEELVAVVREVNEKALSILKSLNLM